ncbi:MAG: calcium-binding protein [Phormidesmis sp.]
MAGRNENYNSVLKFEDTVATLFDNGSSVDGDSVNVLLNDELIAENVVLTAEGTDIPFLVGPGANEFKVVARNVGTVDAKNTVRVEFRESDILLGDTGFVGELDPNQVAASTIGLPLVLIEGDTEPFSARHVLDSIDENLGESILTVSRNGSNDRGTTNVAAYIERNGFQPIGFEVDEVPPRTALDADGELPNYSTRIIPGADNATGGGRYGSQIQNYGGKRIEDGFNIDFGATDDNYGLIGGATNFFGIYGTDGADNNDTSPLVGSRGQSNVIYGFGGDDVLRGEGTRPPGPTEGDDDILLGGDGDDRLGGKGGNDQLLGQADNDILYGDKGDDILYGGPGVDVLFGDDADRDFSGSDTFNLKLGEGIDSVADFDVSDRIALLDGLTFEQLTIDVITSGAFEDGTTPTYPDFPGGIGKVNFGARLSVGSETLAFVNIFGRGEQLLDPQYYVSQPPGRNTLDLEPTTV